MAVKSFSKISRYHDWPRKRVRVPDLFLDPENIRLQVEVKSSQGAVINDLFLNENAMQILENIAVNGFFPDETPVVVKEDDKYVVIDGNRRIAALKALARPQLVPPKETQIRAILESTGAIVRELDVVVAPSRDAVRPFLASKHTQNTRRPWRPLRQAYFYKAELERGRKVDDLRREYPDVEIEKFLRIINIHSIAKAIDYDSERIARTVHNDRKFPASTVERMYEDKQVRNFLGFDFDKDGEVKIKIERKEFEKGLKKIVQDVVEKTIDSRQMNTEKNRRDYLAGWPKSQIPRKRKGKKVITSKEFKVKVPSADAKRRKLAPRDIKVALRAPGVKRMLRELQGIDYRKFPNATHDLLRSFLECGLKAYFDQIGKKLAPLQGRKYVYLGDVLREFKKEMDSQSNRELSQVAQRIISNATMKPYSEEFLNAANHNPSVFVLERDVEEAWDAMERLLRYVLNPPKTKHAKNTP